MMVAQLRLESAGQWVVGQQRVEINRRLGHADALALGRNRAVQKGQRLAIVEPVDFGHEAFDQMQNAVAAIEETLEQRFRIDAAFGAPFVKPILRPRRVLGRRHPRSEEHTSELQSLMRISYAVFCLKKKKKPHT